MNNLLHDLNITLTDEPSPAERDFMHQQIRAYNNQASVYHKNIRPTGWDWLDIDDFWIDELLRGKGYGQKLLHIAETEARTRGCLRTFLTTYSFQARGFYQKFGYRVAGQLDDYPPGSTYYWMRKDF